MRPLLTKLAIVGGFVTYYKLGWWSPGAATTLCLGCLVLSLLIDVGRARNPERRPILFPGFGALVLFVGVVVVPLFAVLNHGTGYEVLDFWGSLGVVFFAASVLRFIFALSEGIGKMAWDIFRGLFGGGNGGGEPAPRKPDVPLREPPYTDFVPPPHWRFQCPKCGARVEHSVDVCWNCDYGDDEPARMNEPPPKPAGLKYQDPIPSPQKKAAAKPSSNGRTPPVPPPPPPAAGGPFLPVEPRD